MTTTEGRATRTRAKATTPARAVGAGTATDATRRVLLTLAQVLEELQIPESTWYAWQAQGKGPRQVKLPNKQVRVDRADLNRWLDERTVDPTQAAA
jgi:predicted DNA-binding transcriptional regulator AlpA